MQHAINALTSPCLTAACSPGRGHTNSSARLSPALAPSQPPAGPRLDLSDRRPGCRNELRQCLERYALLISITAVSFKYEQGGAYNGESAY